MAAICGAAGIELAFKDGIDWILHVDTDELMYPGGSPEYSLQRVLAVFPPDVDTVVFPNYESLPERDDVVDPFTEVKIPSSVVTGLEHLKLCLLHVRVKSCQAMSSILLKSPPRTPNLRWLASLCVNSNMSVSTEYIVQWQ
jgi:hypothetical protein